MAEYTITTTPDQEAALSHAYATKKQIAPPLPGSPPQTPPTTQGEYLQQQVNTAVLDPMVQIYVRDGGHIVMESLATIPVENRAAALEDLKQVIEGNGGTLPSGEDASGAFVTSPFVFPL
jgi:hypothetical protein